VTQDNFHVLFLPLPLPLSTCHFIEPPHNVNVSFKNLINITIFCVSILFGYLQLKTMDKDLVNRFLEGIQLDLKNLVLESKKKYPTIKEVNLKTCKLT